MANSKLLKDAIADAKTVRETAIANAKIALEEAFTPKLQSLLSKKLQSEMEGDDEEESFDDVDDTTDVTDDEDEDVDAGEIEEDDEFDTDDFADDEVDEDIDDEDGDGVIDDPTGASVTEDDEEFEDEDELDLESIIKELEDELNDEPVEDEDETFEDEPVEEDEDVAVDADDEIDLDEILREMGYGDDEDDESQIEEDEDEEDVDALKSDLGEAMKTIKSLRKTINEVNLLNAKLLYTNKLFRSYNLSNEQKVKVVETLDRTGTVREVKLVYSTLAESFKYGSTTTKKKSKLREGLASKASKSTAPKGQIITEGNKMAERFKQLANIQTKKK